MVNETMIKFGYPDGLIMEYERWVVLLRSKQVTAGCVILVCKEEAMSLGEISKKAGAELPKVASDLEGALSAAYKPEKVNYFALMMRDPHVHFHVIPRYISPIDIAGTNVRDSGWPGYPNLEDVALLLDDQLKVILEVLRENWPS